MISVKRALFLACFLLATPASAQSWVPAATTEAASGVEGGGGRTTGLGRAQTRMRLGAELYVDESPADVFGGAVLVGIEPRASFGIDGRYTRIVRERFAFSGGAMVYLQPGSLAGPLAAAEYRYPLGKSFVLTLGPEVDVFVLGSDLPDRTVLWQALFHAGFRVAL